MPLAEWNNRDMLSHFSIVRKLDGGIFPMGFASEVAKVNSNSANTLNAESRLTYPSLFDCLIVFFSPPPLFVLFCFFEFAFSGFGFLIIQHIDSNFVTRKKVGKNNYITIFQCLMSTVDSRRSCTALRKPSSQKLK